MLNQPLLIMETRTKAHTERRKIKRNPKMQYQKHSFGHDGKLNPSAARFHKNANQSYTALSYSLPPSFLGWSYTQQRLFANISTAQGLQRKKVA